MIRKQILLSFFILISPFSVFADEEVKDPIEGFNRGVFAVNDFMDVYLFEPVAKGYDYVTPQPVQDSVNNFFENLGYPSYLLSDVVQLKFGQAAEHTGRFLINSTLGVAGLFDVAKYFGLEEHKEDFGIALAYHDVPPGPYMVLPLIGPTNLRDLVGTGVDVLVNPFFWMARTEMHDRTQNTIIYSAQGLQTIQIRADLIEAIDAGKDSSLDFYSFVRKTYYQKRESLLTDKEYSNSADDLFEDDEDFE